MLPDHKIFVTETAVKTIKNNDNNKYNKILLDIYLFLFHLLRLTATNNIFWNTHTMATAISKKPQKYASLEMNS